MTATHTRRKSAQVRLKTIALPTQHGGWGFVLEPVVLGLLVAPSWAGLLLGIAALGAFLMHQPLKLFGKDILRRQFVPRTRWAARFAAGYGGVALLCFGAALALSSPAMLVPLLCALPLAGFQLWQDIRGQGREAIAEIAGSLTFGAVAVAIALMDGWLAAPAVGLWLALGARNITSILYVRARLRLTYGQPVQRLLIAVMHGAAAMALVGCVAISVLPATTLIGYGVLTVRMGVGLWVRSHAPARVVGFQEIFFGFVYVLLIAVG